MKHTRNKMLRVFLSLCIVMACFVAMAAIANAEAVVGGTSYTTLQEALAHVSKDTPLTSVTEDLWPPATPVYAVANGSGNFYASIDPATNVGGMPRALAGYTQENYTTTDLTIYCRPNATITKNSHSAIFGNVTIYGNGASLGGSWEPCPEYNNQSGYPTMTKDIRISIYNLNDGAAVWGMRCTNYKLDVHMENCLNAHEIMLNGSSGSSNTITNITVKNCTFICPPGGCAHTGVIIATTNPGTVTIDNCSFKDSSDNFAININNKNGGKNNVTISNCTFTNCGNTSSKSAVRICGEVETATLSATLSKLTFTDCNNKCDIEIGKGGNASENLSTVSYKISDTTGDLYVYTRKTGDTIKNNGSTALSSGKTYTGNNKPTPQIVSTDLESTYLPGGISIPVDGMFTIPNDAGTATYHVAPDGTSEGAGVGTYKEGKLIVTKCGVFIVTLTTTETDTYDTGTATAKLTVNSPSVEVTFKANYTGANPASTTRLVPQYIPYQLPANEFTPPTGHVFAHWQIGDKKYPAGDTVTITGNTTILAVWITTEAGLDSELVKVETSDLKVVPEQLKTEYPTVQAIGSKLFSQLLANGRAESLEQAKLYDVKLMISNDNGRTWEEADINNFPSEGLEVLLGYPKGTGPNGWVFGVSHMFTETVPRLGTTAGKVETPPVVKTPNGLLVKLKGLSPVMISWQKEEINPDSLPRTGDNSNVLIYVLIGVLALTALTVMKKKKLY